MRRIRFNAPPHHKLILAGRTIHGGEEAEVPNEAAEEAVINPRIDVIDVTPHKKQQVKQDEPEATGEGHTSNPDQED